MQQREFGHTGLHVSLITLGSWPMSGDRYGRIDDSEAVITIRRALEQGITSFDTAPAYGAGHAEETLGAALAGRRDEAVITTKCGIVPSASGPPGRNASRASILREIDDSLRRLRTDHVDVYLVHWPDPKTPVAETMGELCALRSEGKLRAIGVSNFSVARMEEARKALGDVPLASAQPKYNLIERGAEKAQAVAAATLARARAAVGLLPRGPG